MIKNILKIVDMQTKILGVILIIIGTSMIAYPRFNSAISQEVVDSGKIKIYNEKPHPIRWSMIIGVVIIVGGIGMLLRDKKIGV